MAATHTASLLPKTAMAWPGGLPRTMPRTMPEAAQPVLRVPAWHPGRSISPGCTCCPWREWRWASLSNWVWQRTLDGVGWQEIGGAHEGTYLVRGADAGHYLRVLVSYRTPGGELKTLEAYTERVSLAPAPGDEPGLPAGLAAGATAESTPAGAPAAAAAPVPAGPSPGEPAVQPAAAATGMPNAEALPTPAVIPVSPLVTASIWDTRVVINPGAGKGQAADRGMETMAGTPGERPAAVDLPTPAGVPGDGAPTMERAASGNGRGMMVWAVMALFAALVVCGGYGYYRVRLRRR